MGEQTQKFDVKFSVSWTKIVSSFLKFFIVPPGIIKKEKSLRSQTLK